MQLWINWLNNFHSLISQKAARKAAFFMLQYQVNNNVGTKIHA